MRRLVIRAAFAWALSVGVSRAAPPATAEQSDELTSVAAATNVLSTGFEAQDGWDLDFSVCGASFAPTCPPNCSPEDPNENTGWSSSPNHCREPSIRNAHPFAGDQHLRFQFDPTGGSPPGCTGFFSRCQQQAITPIEPVSEISRTVWSYEIAFSGLFPQSLIAETGQWGESFEPTTHAYWYYNGGVYVYDFHGGRYVLGGFWADHVPDYVNYTIDLDPCRNQIRYSFNGMQFFTETYDYFPASVGLPYVRPATTNAGVYTTDHNTSEVAIDLDNHSVTHTPCEDACCDGATGECLDGLSESECLAASNLAVWHENVPCERLGVPGRACDDGPDFGKACQSDADCASPGHCLSLWPPGCGTGACCDHGAGAGGPGPEGACTDEVPREQCAGAEQVWHSGLWCEAVECLELGACCHTLDGSCADDVPQDACDAAQLVWTSAATCAEVDCDAVLGACCDGDTFGACSQTVRAECVCPACSWTKLAACADIECAHQAIPTVSTWGLAVMTVVLVIAAKLRFRRAVAPAV